MDLIRKINDKLSLVYDNGLHIKSDGKIITSNLYEIGTLTNGLLPLYYKNENKRKGSFSYLDCSTNNIFPIDNVRWISGFHFEGNNLNYIDHDYRTNPDASYRIKCVTSTNLLDWEDINGFGLDIDLDSKWDNEMVAYPHVFKYNNELQMLYNGNTFGKTGIGHVRFKN